MFFFNLKREREKTREKEGERKREKEGRRREKTGEKEVGTYHNLMGRAVSRMDIRFIQTRDGIRKPVAERLKFGNFIESAEEEKQRREKRGRKSAKYEHQHFRIQYQHRSRQGAFVSEHLSHQDG